VKKRADEGDREAQHSLGTRLLCEARGDMGTPLDAAGRATMTDVGFALCTETFLVARVAEMRRCHTTVDLCYNLI